VELLCDFRAIKYARWRILSSQHDGHLLDIEYEVWPYVLPTKSVNSWHRWLSLSPKAGPSIKLNASTEKLIALKVSRQ
jgi:hypothetical protein